MAQVITPPTVGHEEDRAKDWYRAEALRKLYNELSNICGEIYGTKAAAHLVKAMAAISEARKLLSPDQKG